ncbi:MAG: hypothetical protein AAB412_05430 [Elusimicrobiota bacterium]
MRRLGVPAAFLLLALLANKYFLALLGADYLAGGWVSNIFFWEFSWFGERLREGQYAAAWFTRDILFPIGSRVIVESPLALALALPLERCLGAAWAFNLLWLASYPAAGWAMYALALRLTANARASFLAGFLFMFSHYSLTQHRLGHLHETLVFLLPLFLLRLLIFRREEGKRGFFFLAAASAAACMGSPYIAASALISGAVLLAAEPRAPTGCPLPAGFWRGLCAALALASAAGAAAYWPALAHPGSLLGGEDTYRLSLLSFLDYPSWHPSGWIQALRRHTTPLPPPVAGLFLGRAGLSGQPGAEHLMGFFGLGICLLLAAGARAGAWRGRGRWAALGFVGLLLALGPSLGPLRAPARFILLAWTASCVLAAYSFAELEGSLRRSWKKTAAAALLCAVYAWESGLMAAPSGERMLWGGAYEALLQDTAPGALLELPAGVSASGQITLNVERFMAPQRRHRRPLVIGRPPGRYARESLAFLQETGLVFELAHPQALLKLYGEPALAGRLETLARTGRKTLSKAGIRAVLLHTDDALFSREVLEAYERLLRRALGEPRLIDETGAMLFFI